MKSIFKRLFFLLILIILLSSCGMRPIGHALVLWADKESSFKTGELVKVIKKSEITKIYLVQYGNSRQLMEMPFWRVHFYSTISEAEQAAKDYSENITAYAYSEKAGLPIREKADNEAKRTYKLRHGQIVKIISREDKLVNIAGYEDYWYSVLTQDGYEGFCFGHFLHVFNAEGKPEVEAAKLMDEDPVLDKILSSVWRPEYFKEMSEKRRIDLFKFSKSYGLSPQRAKNRIDLVTPKYRMVFEYKDIEKLGSMRYHFTGTDLRIHLIYGERLVITFNRNEQLISQVFIRYEEDIDEIITCEYKRREKLFRQFILNGNVLKSTAYGSINLYDDMSFLWKDFGQLGSQLFLKPVAGGGTVDFPYFLCTSLSSKYDGIITFRFSEYQGQEETNFIYTFDDSGIRFLFVRPEDIEDMEAVRTGISPLVIYFVSCNF